MRATSVSLNTHCIVPENVHTPPTHREIWFETFNSSEISNNPPRGGYIYFLKINFSEF